MSNLAARLYRMKLMTEIKKFVEGIPVKEMVERQMENCVYAGDGVVDTGMVRFPTTVKIVPDNGKLQVVLHSKKARIEAVFPFDGQAAEAVGAVVEKYLN